MSAAVLVMLIPLTYLSVMAACFFLTYRRLERDALWECDGYRHAEFPTLACERCGRQAADRGPVTNSWLAFPVAIFWPLTLWLFGPWLLANSATSDGLSRKQRAQLAYERESAKIAAEAAKAQQEWQRLLAEEQAS